jgi:hypothetical protein
VADAGQAPKKETVYSGPTPGVDNKGFTQPGTLYSGPSGTGKATATAPARAGVAPQAVASATWFYTIAGLSVLNSLIVMVGGHIRFIFGLGITSIFDYVGNKTGGAGMGASFVINLFVAGVLVLLGYFARKGLKWAFLVGMIAYGLDALLMFTMQDWLGLAFHGWALFRIGQGLKYAE